MFPLNDRWSTHLALAAAVMLSPAATAFAQSAAPGAVDDAVTYTPDAAPGAPIQLLPPAAPAAPRVYPQLTEAQAQALVRMLRDAPQHGLAAARIPSADASDRTALIDAAMAQAVRLRNGQLSPTDFPEDWGLRPAPYDPWPDFNRAVADGRLAQWIADLPPPYAGYDGLRKALARYRTIADKGGWPRIAEGPPIGKGATGPRVASLRKRLRAEDDTIAATGEFDTALQTALQRAQKRFGVEPTGTLGPATLAALNVSTDDRIGQIMANMERWRWLPRELSTNRIQVNIAAAVLTRFEGDTPVSSMRAVTGRPGDETPMLQSSIHSVVLNPPWNVPTSIATKELWPKERKNPGYLKRNGFRVIETPEGGKRLQQSSERSALGKLKFDFDNPYAVYLHDTPAQATFNQFDRLASHGCVRLQRPVELAKEVFATTPEWTPTAIDEALAKGKTVRAKLAQPVSIYLLYWTAFASGNGATSLRADPYKWDKLLADKLAAKGATTDAPTVTASRAPLR
ncbi:L,D-transpeptidase family protein [Sphingomonas sp. 1P06PA]|uniref:L,D-transpeptidase family protein n=1 Tax=Sphingomonas sp. 1P06PA TaxID=554121 RepID=UPI0039A42F6F